MAEKDFTNTRAIILSGYGTNCEEETKYAFGLVGVKSDIIHINDVLSDKKKLLPYNILVFPGGFSYGDDTGSGKAFANKLRNNYWQELMELISRDTLTLGICNGFQILTNLGILPALNNLYGENQVALVHNDSARYETRWVDLEFNKRGIWTKGIGTISLPIAHGEGNFYAENKFIMRLEEKKMIAAKYVYGDICEYQDLEANPNGSEKNIASITNENGRIIGMMPHPERAVNFTQLPNWTYVKEILQRQRKEIPEEGPGLKIFRNAAEYFK